MTTKSTITGLDHVRRTLRLIEPNITSETRVAIASAAGMVLRQALANVPRKTGTLASQLRITYSGDRLSAKIGVIGVRAARKAYYAHWVEYGTRKTPAHPFLHPALEEVGPKAIKLIDAAIDRALTAAVNGDGPSDGGDNSSGGDGGSE